MEGPVGQAALGLDGELTALVLDGDPPVLVYVRENIKLPRQLLTASARLGLRTHGRGPRTMREVLELAAPAAVWSAVAARVAAMDALGRPVLPHRQMTAAWAEQQLCAAGVVMWFYEDGAGWGLRADHGRRWSTVVTPSAPSTTAAA